MSLRPSSRDLDEVDAVVPLTADTIERATDTIKRYVTSQSLDTADERQLLNALGLLP
jgi:hypothetical protein